MANPSIWSLMVRTGILVAIFGLFVIIPAGTFDWIAAWTCLVTVFLVFEATAVYFWKNNRALIQSRGSMAKPKEKWDIILYAVLMISLFSLLVVAGLDYRLGISDIPEMINIGVVSLVLLELITYFLVMKENTYLSKVVEIQEDQQVISTGLYRYVRHPLYAGNSMLVIGVCLILDLLLALVPALVLFILSMVIKIFFEEKILSKELHGYSDYRRKVRYRLIPYVW